MRVGLSPAVASLRRDPGAVSAQEESMRKKGASKRAAGSRQGSTPGAPEETEESRRKRAERAHAERTHLIENPNFNQAGNELGSQDQSSGSQTGADID
jgi:hypothetical protein